MPDRQHLRVHRPGARGVGADDPGAGPAQGAGALPGADRHGLPHPALRRRHHARDARDRRHPRHLQPAGHRRSRPPGRRPPRLGDRRPARLPLRRGHPAAAHRQGAVRLREDRRGLRHGLHLLRDPAVSRHAPQPRARRHRARGRGARRARRAGGDPGLAGHARLRPRPARQRRHRRPAARARDDTRMPWIRPMYLHPAHVNDRLVERWAHGAGRAVPGHAGPARRRRDLEVDAPRGDGAADARHRRAVPRRDPRGHRAHDGAGRLPRRDGGRVRAVAGVRRGGALRSPRRLHVLAGGRHGLARRSPIR